MTEMTPETLGPDDLRRLADLLERPTRYGATTARDGMRAAASAWEADRKERDLALVDARQMKACWDAACNELAEKDARIEALENRLVLIRTECDASGRAVDAKQNILKTIQRMVNDHLDAETALAKEEP